MASGSLSHFTVHWSTTGTLPPPGLIYPDTCHFQINGQLTWLPHHSGWPKRSCKVRFWWVVQLDILCVVPPWTAQDHGGNQGEHLGQDVCDVGVMCSLHPGPVPSVSLFYYLYMDQEVTLGKWWFQSGQRYFWGNIWGPVQGQLWTDCVTITHDHPDVVKVMDIGMAPLMCGTPTVNDYSWGINWLSVIILKRHGNSGHKKMQALETLFYWVCQLRQKDQ